jgi:GDP-D-mannose dehydratase
MRDCNVIRSNHESERRGETFASGKNYAGRNPNQACVTADAASWKSRLETRLRLCENYVEAMWLMLQAEELTISSSQPEKRTPLENFSMKR